mmetsp:Transcript_20616/g.30990  ORF Transcript_20616/g.30990 Transcript_20616/m.30990 type:complete len:96 (+) Transcript_20616:792-1079(+)
MFRMDDDRGDTGSITDGTPFGNSPHSDIPNNREVICLLLFTDTNADVNACKMQSSCVPVIKMYRFIVVIILDVSIDVICIYISVLEQVFCVKEYN